MRGLGGAAHPSTASVPITVLLYNGSLLCGFNLPVRGLTESKNIASRTWLVELMIELCCGEGCWCGCYWQRVFRRLYVRPSDQNGDFKLSRTWFFGLTCRLSYSAVAGGVMWSFVLSLVLSVSRITHQRTVIHSVREQDNSPTHCHWFCLWAWQFTNALSLVLSVSRTTHQRTVIGSVCEQDNSPTR